MLCVQYTQLMPLVLLDKTPTLVQCKYTTTQHHKDKLLHDELCLMMQVGGWQRLDSLSHKNKWHVTTDTGSLESTVQTILHDRQEFAVTESTVSINVKQAEDCVYHIVIYRLVGARLHSSLELVYNTPSNEAGHVLVIRNCIYSKFTSVVHLRDATCM